MKRKYISPEFKQGENKTNYKSPEIIWSQGVILNPPSYIGFPPIPKCFRLSLPFFPQNPNIYDPKIPISVLASPEIEDNIEIKNIDANQFPKCPVCFSFLSKHHIHEFSKKQIICPICLTSYPIDNNLDPSIYTMKEDIYDLRNASHDIKTDFFPTYIIAVEITKRSIETGFTQCFCKSLINTLNEMTDDTHILLITFNDSFTIYHTDKNKETIVAALDCVRIPTIKISSLSESRSHYIRILSKISLMKECDIVDSCLGEVYKAALNIISVAGLFIVCATQYPTVGPRMLKKPPQSELFPDQVYAPLGKRSFYRKCGIEMNKKGITVHMFIASRGNEEVSTTAIPVSLTNGQIHCFGDFKREDSEMVLDAELSKLLLQDFFWCARGYFIYPYGLRPKERTSCGGIPVKPGQVSLSSYPTSYSLLQEFEFDGKKSVKSATFQFQLRYFDKHGRCYVRVMTVGGSVVTDRGMVRERADQGVVFATITRRVAYKKLVSIHIAAVEALDSIRDKAITSLLQFFAAGPVLRDRHTFGEDGRIAETLQILSFSILDLMIYLCKRTMYFGPKGAENPAVFAVHSLSSVAFIVSPKATPEYLQAAFGVDSVDKLPKRLPILPSEENAMLNNFATEFTKNIRTYVFMYK